MTKPKKPRTITQRAIRHAFGKCPKACCGELAKLRKDAQRLDWIQGILDAGEYALIFTPEGRGSVRSEIDRFIRAGGKK